MRGWPDRAPLDLALRQVRLAQEGGEETVHLAAAAATAPTPPFELADRVLAD
jgi:hypothetical protein